MSGLALIASGDSNIYSSGALNNILLTSPYSRILLEFYFSGASHRLWTLLIDFTGVIGSSSMFQDAILNGLVAGPVEWPEYGPETIFLQKGSSSKFDCFRLKAGGEKSS